MFYSGPIGRDRYSLVESSGQNWSRNLTGRTQKAIPSASGRAVLLCIGQSTFAAHGEASQVTAGANVYNASPYDDRLYDCIDPPLGCTYQDGCGSIVGRIGDALISASTYSSVILLPIAVNGSAVADWAAGGAYNARISVALRRLANMGLAPTGVLWMQGEADTTAGTNQTNYGNALASVIATIRGPSDAPAFSGTIFVAQCSYVGGTGTSSAVRAAQAAAVNHGANIWAGPDADSLTGANRDSGGTHWSTTGANAIAGLWKDAIALNP